MKKRTGYLIRRGKVFYAAWTIAGRKFMRSTGKRDRRDAEMELRRIMEPFTVAQEVDILRNIAAKIEGHNEELARLEDERNPPLLLAAGWAAYLNAPTARGKKRPTGHRPDSGVATLGQYEIQYEAFVKWATAQLGIKTLANVTTDAALNYAAHLVKTVSGATFNKHIGLLQLVWTVLSKPGRVVANPWAEVGRKQAAAQSRRELTIGELKTVCAAASGEMRLLFALGLYTGLRLGDAATLRWAEVNLSRKMIRRVPSKTSRYLDGTGQPQAVVIPIHPSLATMLNETAADDTAAGGPELVGSSEYVMPSMASLYMQNSGGLSKQIQRHFKSCGIKIHRTGTGEGADQRAVVEVGFHSLRHTFVSLCRESDAPLAVVEKIVGHSNPAMTRHYSHVSEAAAALAVGGLPIVLGNVQTPALSAGDPMTALRINIRNLADNLTKGNWREIKEQLRMIAVG